MNEPVLTTARDVLVLAGLVVAVLAIVRGFPIRLAVGAGLELWIAGGLLTLSSALDSWEAIGSVVLIIAVRRLVVTLLPRGPVPALASAASEDERA